MSEVKESVPTLVFGEVLDEKQMLAETEPKQELKEQLDETMLTKEKWWRISVTRLTFIIPMLFYSMVWEHRRKWQIFQEMLLKM